MCPAGSTSGRTRTLSIGQRRRDLRWRRDLAHPPIGQRHWGCHFLCPRLPSESYGLFLIPACFHHGIPLTKGGADVPLGAGWPGSPGGGCVT